MKKVVDQAVKELEKKLRPMLHSVMGEGRKATIANDTPTGSTVRQEEENITHKVVEKATYSKVVRRRSRRQKKKNDIQGQVGQW